MNRFPKAHLIALLATAMLVGCSFFLTGCNTTKGAGRDIERAGEGLQKSANKHGAD